MSPETQPAELRTLFSPSQGSTGSLFGLTQVQEAHLTRRLSDDSKCHKALGLYSGSDPPV